MKKKNIFVVIVILFTIMSCKTSQLSNAAIPAAGMIKVSVLYPNENGKTFDMDYYEKNHMPMMAGFLGKNLKFYEIDKGIAGRTAKDPVPFVAACHFYCTSMEEYNAAIGKNIEAIMADIKKYTNIQPTIQISEVRQVKSNLIP